MFALISVLLTATVSSPFGLCIDFTGAEDITVWRVLLRSPDGAHRSVQSVGVFRTLSDCIVNLLIIILV